MKTFPDVDQALAVAGLSSWWRMQRAGWQRPATVCLMPAGASDEPHTPDPQDELVPAHDEALVAWRAWCQRHAGRRVRVALSGRWVMNAMVAGAGRPRPWAGGRPLADAVEQAASQWEHYLGLGPATLAQGWVLRSAQVPGGTLVCAVPRAFVDDLLAVAAHHRVRVDWLGPWWAWGLQRWLARPADDAPSSLPTVASMGATPLTLYEPGWCVCVESRGRRLTRLWTQRQDAEQLAPPTAPRLASSATALMDDEATVALVEGLSPVWRTTP